MAKQHYDSGLLNRCICSSNIFNSQYRAANEGSCRHFSGSRKGDLTQKISTVGKDETSQLMQSLAEMQQNLRDTLSHIANSSSQLASAAEELNSVTEDASRGIQQQNDEIQQAATAITEMSSAVDEVANTAVLASEASEETARSTELGKNR